MSAGAEPRQVTARELVLILAVACAAFVGCVRSINPEQELEPNLELALPFDPDTVNVFHAFDRDPSLAYVVSWFAADGPQGVHTFRPLQYTMMRMEYACFGRTVWPYQVVNALLFVVTVGGLAMLLRSCGVSQEVTALAAILTFAVWTMANHTVINLICTQSEVLCGLFGVWATWLWFTWLERGGRRWLAGYAALLLAAFLAKEMALGMALALLVAAGPWPAPARRRTAVIVVTILTTSVWLLWFKFAESRMTILAEAIPPGHTFEDLWQRLARGPVTAGLFWLHASCAPAGQIGNLLGAGVDLLELPFSITFQHAVLQLLLWVPALLLAAARWPRLIWLWACWNVLTYLPVLPLHDAYHWYLFVPDLLDRAFDALGATAGVLWLRERYQASARAQDWVAGQRRRLPVVARWGWRRVRRWWRDASPQTIERIAWAALVLAAWPHFARLPVTQPLDTLTDIDGLRKLEGIARDPSVRAMLHFFIGDDPQGVHTFRPFPAATLWLEWHLWGFTRWAYMLSNMAWFIATAGALRCFMHRLRSPGWVAWSTAAFMVAWPTRGTLACTQLIATRHDLTCALAGLLALMALLDWLENGRGRQLAAWFGWSMLAYLSKEMAIALLPLAFLVCVIEVRGGRCWRKAAPALVVAVAAAGLYLVWYKVAESNMGPFNVDEHSFGGMLRKMLENAGTTAQLTVHNLSRPLGAIVRQIRAAGLQPLWSTIFWKDLLALVVCSWGFLWLLRERTRALAIIYVWKICCYGPVMPLHDIWPWYEYMPHVLDYALPVMVLDLAWEEWGGVARMAQLGRRVAAGLRRASG